MREITLQEVLDARELRVARQRRLLQLHQKPLLVLNMNIAGPVKRSRLIDFAFCQALESISFRLKDCMLRQEVTDAVTGLEAIWVCDMAPEMLKELAIEEETARPVGRLYDLDVICVNGEKLSRQTPRTCLVCGGPVGICARSRAHGLPAVQAKTEELLQGFAAERLADLAVEALVAEVDLTPKPGLVDRRNAGAHRDMDIDMFYRSAHCLHAYFQRAAELGVEQDDCMKLLQQAGLEAEQTMFGTTGGVNTHKGAIYAFGILLAALGGVLKRGGDVFDRAAALAKQGVPAENTHGAQVKRRYGAFGAREEALAGFPHARAAQKMIREHEENSVPAFLMLLSQVEDTNLLYRGGEEGLRFVQKTAQDILAGPAEEYAAKLTDFDDRCIERNLSPGGSADLLALALFLDCTRTIWGSL